MQREAVRAAGTDGPINQLRTVSATLDFNALIGNLRAGRREAAEAQVAQACRALRGAGADFLVVTSGTTSTLTGLAREQVALPFLDLAEAAWVEVAAAGPVGLLATSYSVAGGIFEAPAARRGVALLTPPTETAARLDAAIFGPLVRGEVTDAFLRLMADAAAALVARGAASIILGNTDMTLAAEPLARACPVPLVDAACAHARAAARAALEGLGESR